MILFEHASIDALTVHAVGNKSQESGFTAATALYAIDENTTSVLRRYFFTPFKGDDLYHLDHEADVALNEVYAYAQKIFAAPGEAFVEQAAFLLEHLYNASDHPAVKPGEVYIAYIADCIVEDEMTDAIGIFKSENKDTYLKFGETQPAEEDAGGKPHVAFKIEAGVNIGKLDKGCLIFNTDAERGFLVAMVGATSADAQYWREGFLRVKPMQNSTYLTAEVLRMCREFSQDVFAPEEKTEKAAFLNKSISYFQGNETFDSQSFAETVLDADEEKKEKFKKYKESFTEELGLSDDDTFTIAPAAVKTAKRKFRSIIKLDTDIEIKLSPNPSSAAEQNIERGYDEERSMYYYKVFFSSET